MFTGIIEATAEVLHRDDRSIIVARPSLFDDLKLGSSVAISGVCLTVVKMDDESLRFDVVPETFAKSNLGTLRAGDRVNLERAMRADARFDGHVVQGHIEGVGEIVAIVSSIPRPLPPREEGESYSKKPVLASIVSAARSMRSNPTASEAILWNVIRYDQLGVRFRRQYPLGGRILDFYCPKHRLCIEVDGGIHQNAKAKKEDELRSEYLLKGYAVRVIRFTNDEIAKQLPQVLDHIQKAINSPPPVEEGLGVEENGGESGVTLALRVPRELLPYIIPKGSIALDGVSLTIASVADDILTVALIPETLRQTTFGDKKEGDAVNIETDIFVRALLHQRG